MAGNPSQSQIRGEHDRTIARGAGVNVLGIIGKSLQPVFLILVTRLYGPALTGVYYLAATLVDICVALSVSGLADGVLMFASRSLERDGRPAEDFYRVLANALVSTLAVSLLLVLLSRLVAPALIRAYYTQSGLAEAVQVLVLALPLMGLTNLIVAATRAMLIMKWDALLLGFLKPGLLTVFATLFYLCGFDMPGLLWGFVLSHALLAGLALWVFCRTLSLRRLGRACLGLRPFWPLLAFAGPQNLNQTFNQLIGSLDAWVLGAYGYPSETIAFYGIGVQICRNIRQIKLAFSTILAPIIARFHERRDMQGLSDSLTTVARWAATLGLPVVLLIGILRSDLLRVFHPSFTMDSSFMLLLLAQPMLVCSFGLAGNVVVNTGRSLWNLANSLSVAGLNLLLLWFLVPWAGLRGAALASLSASVLITLAEVSEARFLAGVRFHWRGLWKPWAAFGLGLLLAGLAWLLGLDGHLASRIATALACLAGYVLVLRALGIDARDHAVLYFWRRSSRKGQAST